MPLDAETKLSFMEDDSRYSGGLPEYDRKFYAKYEEKLAMEKAREGSIVISLRETPGELEEDVLNLLENKLTVYTERVERRIDRYSVRPSGELLGGILDANYRRLAVKLLLERGEINTWALSNAFGDIDGGNTTDFNEAIAVIHDYVKTGGKNTRR